MLVYQRVQQNDEDDDDDLVYPIIYCIQFQHCQHVSTIQCGAGFFPFTVFHAGIRYAQKINKIIVFLTQIAVRKITGWWFGTFFIFPYTSIGNVIIPID